MSKSQLEDRFLNLLMESVDGLEAPTREVRFHKSRRWRFDFAWEAPKVAIEINGNGYGHSSIAGRFRDSEKTREAQALGWTVIPVTSKCLSTRHRDDTIDAVIRIISEKFETYLAGNC
jgi:very-short-patch-repair endonuclease